MTDVIFGLVLDPSEVADSDRVELDLNGLEGIAIEQSGIDWGDSALASFTSDARYGSAQIDWRAPNRTITVPIGLGMDDSDSFTAARRQLQEKVALISTQQGWLKRQQGSVKSYADIVTAALTLPDRLGETAGLEPGGELVLTTLPDFWGDEITLDAMSGTGLIDGVLLEDGEPAVIEGDYPARARIVVADTSGNDQRSLLWGVRSRHYDPASTAKLFYEAEALTPVNGAAVTSLSGASGGVVVEITGLPAGVWVPMLSTDLLAGNAPLTHKGAYRVRARAGVYGALTTCQLRFLWGVGSLSVPEQNDPVQIPGIDALYLLDLGTILLNAPPVGPNEWFGAWQAMVADSAAVVIDCVYLEPLDDSSGNLVYVNVPPASAIAAADDPSTAADDASAGTVAWTNVGGGGFPGGGSALITLPAADRSHYLDCTDFGFDIPSGATIVGIVATINRQTSLGAITDQAVQLIKGGAIQATSRATGAVWSGDRYFGGTSDLWGTTWTPAQINASNFGIAFAGAWFEGIPPVGGNAVGKVSSVQIAVYYTLASGFTIAQDAVIYADQTAELRTDGMFRTDPTGAVYGRASGVIGDLPRIPPSGMEGRPCELLVKPSRGDLDTLEDGGLDDLTAQVIYRPCYLTLP